MPAKFGSCCSAAAAATALGHAGRRNSGLRPLSLRKTGELLNARVALPARNY